MVDDDAASRLRRGEAANMGPSMGPIVRGGLYPKKTGARKMDSVPHRIFHAHQVGKSDSLRSLGTRTSSFIISSCEKAPNAIYHNKCDVGQYWSMFGSMLVDFCRRRPRLSGTSEKRYMFTHFQNPKIASRKIMC